MREQASGAIVNCSSVDGLVGLPKRAAYHGLGQCLLRPVQSEVCESLELVRGESRSSGLGVGKSVLDSYWTRLIMRALNA